MRLRTVFAIILLLYLGLAAYACWAGDATLTWVAPTQRTDGSALTNLAGFKVYYGTDPAALTTTVDIADPLLTQHVITALTPATWYFAMTAYDADGLESDRTQTVSKVIVAAPPSPPTGLTVQAGNLTVYTVVKRPDRFALVPIGTVPEGTQCDTSQSVNGYYAVPTASVTWSGNIRPVVVVAQCG